jgi:hypothetical protein
MKRGESTFPYFVFMTCDEWHVFDNGSVVYTGSKESCIIRAKILNEEPFK